LVTLGLFAAGAAGPAAADDLTDALARLQSADPLVSDAAVEAIVACGTPVVDALLPLLDDPRRDVRAGAIRGLGLSDDPRAAAAVRYRLADALAPPRPDDKNARYHRILLVQAAGRQRDTDAAPLLRRVAESTDPFERAHASISLFLFGGDPGYDLVLECLGHADAAVRNVVTEGLGESGAEEARDLLLARTSDESWIVRDSAFRGLARWRGHEKVAEAWQRGAADPSGYVRRTVAEYGS
jgi:HEAT repeat protein